MKKILIITSLAFLVLSCKKNNDKVEETTNDESSYNPGAGWSQVWSEEFDGTSLNTSFWNYETGAGGWGNAELQNYTTNNISQKDGNLVITAKREIMGTSPNYTYFTSGRLTSKNKYDFKYGKIVGRIKLPEGYGIWPAFWMLGASSQAWPACGEIDILEMKGGQGTEGDYTNYSTCHWANSSGAHQYYGGYYTAPNKLSAGYHYYEVEWNATSITSRFDGHQFNQLNITAAEASELRDNNYFIILNLAVGGNFFSPAITNQANVTATFPQKMYVDWVRVYKQ